MIKVLFLTINLGGGGAERVLVNLVNNMDTSNFDITVETMFDGGVNRQLLNSDVKYICRKAPCLKGITVIYEFISAHSLYRYFVGKEHYDIVVAYMHGSPVKVISGCSDPYTKKVAWLHNGTPSTGSFFKPWLFMKNAFKSYSSCNRIVGVANSVCKAFSDYTGITERIVTLYNTNDTLKIQNMSHEPYEFPFPVEKPVICSVGGLSKVKGYDRLITVAKQLHDEGYKFTIIIAGKGPCEKEFHDMISEYDAESYIHLLGFQNNPYSIMKKSDFFISSSRDEGLATVLTEALTIGLPVISTDVSGAKEVLGENDEYGFVVDNSTDGIYNGMKLFLSDSSVTEKYRLVSKDRATNFNTENTVNAVEKMLEEVISE